ncbi:MAG: response regulator [Propionibacteriales bacterium]|nr:response regulator [Propionibacteriales bacterium]
MDDIDLFCGLLEQLHRGSRAGDPEELLAQFVVGLVDSMGVPLALVLRGSTQTPVVAHAAGVEVAAAHVAVPAGSELQEATVPRAWREAGVGSIKVLPLPGDSGMLVLGWDHHDSPAQEPAAESLVASLTSVLVESLARMVVEAELADLTARVQGAQQLAGMGDYDWHISSDTNRWSDQLYRIYGYEPQSFNASYDRFLGNIHPEDRERIQAIHQRAYATGEPYGMIERIVRPDGEIRYLSSNGEVIMDPNGTPVRMRGTCIDVTERILAEHERELVAQRLSALVAASPEAILVIDKDSRIVQSNPRASELLGGEVSGQRIDQILPGPTVGTGVAAVGLDGTDLILDITRVALSETDNEATAAMFLADAKPRLEREALAERLGESRARRRQAFELNDSVVQGLAAASYSLDQSDLVGARSYLDVTLGAARTMMGNLLEPRGGVLSGGDLVRTTSAQVAPGTEGGPERVEEPRRAVPEPTSPRVLIVDDSEDIRTLLRLQLTRVGGFDIIGEAADGLDGVDKARSLRPDLVLLDLAMPRMDGLQALPMIRAAVPGVRVIVLSGFNTGDLEAQALSAGADRYLTKGGTVGDLVAAINGVLEAA